MKVIPTSFFCAITGLWLTPVRGVSAECLTNFPNCLALRRIVILSMDYVY